MSTAPQFVSGTTASQLGRMACALSLVCHLTFAITLALTVVSGQHPQVVPLAVSSFVEPAEVDARLERFESLNVQTEPLKDTPWEATSGSVGDSSPVVLPEMVESFVEENTALAHLSQVVAVGGTGVGEEGEGAGGDTGPGSFFGLRPLGGKTVFVVDASQSMNHPHPAPAGTRFRRVKLELLKTIGEMPPEEQFFIMFFNDQAVPMPAQQLMEATPEAQQAYLRWMVDVPAQGKTKPLQALLLALQLRPDTIYLLTDGDFPLKISEIVTKANTSGTAIHTIGFGDNTGEEVLKAMARQNGGRYRFISEQ
jgi:hypothetical protein